MSHQIILKEDGTVAIFCGIMDDFLFDGISIEQWIEYRIKWEAEKVRDKIKYIHTKLISGDKPYYQFTMTYKEACSLRDANL